MNAITFAGNLTAPPTIRFLPNGKAVASLTVAIPERTKRDGAWVDDGASFIDVQAWGSLAENVADLGKGQRVIVTGRIHQHSWQDKDGNKRSRLEVIADDIGTSMLFAPRIGTRGREQSAVGDPWATVTTGAPSTEKAPF